MEIAYQKSGVFTIKNKKTSISIGMKLTKEFVSLQTSLVICVENEYPYSDSELFEQCKGKIIRSPGEYEIDGIIVTGVPIIREEKNEKIIMQTAFKIKARDTNFCYFGSTGSDIQAIHYSQLENVDVLFLLVTKESIEKSNAIIQNLEPSIVIPFSPTDKQSDINDFCKKRGLPQIAPVKNYVLNKADINPEEEKVLLFA